MPAMIQVLLQIRYPTPHFIPISQAIPGPFICSVSIDCDRGMRGRALLAALRSRVVRNTLVALHTNLLVVLATRFAKACLYSRSLPPTPRSLPGYP